MDTLNAMLEAIRAAQATPSSSDLETALSLARAAQTSARLPAPPNDLELDLDPAPSLLDIPRAPSPPPVSSSSASALNWLHASLPAGLVQQALDILQSPSSDDDISESLLELYGFEKIDSVGEAVQRRADIVAAASSALSEVQPTPRPPPQHHHQPPPHLSAPPPRDRTPQAQVLFHTAEELAAAKKAKKAQQRLNRGRNARGEYDDDADLDLEEWERIRQESLAQGPGPLVSGKRPDHGEPERYPNVYLASGANGGQVALGGQKMAMPVGTTREDRDYYEEITIPAPKPVPFRFDEELMPISQMDAWGRRTFHAYKTLNRLQSIVFPVAYNTNENMLVCAPTGAGKTDVALLSILRCLSSLTSTPLVGNEKPTLPPPSTYKIIYVAPLKALAAEITLKFAKRLSWAGVKCRELTGDMKLTKKEVDETGVIVTTPEKWDVVTRKGAGAGDGDVADKVKLLIIDEVHLLHEDRGAVIESIVARTLRQVESSQSLIRIVGLSATLPNYVDVADFLRVNRYQGLFYFDASFRPVPLEQHFVGVKGKAGSIASRTGLDNAAFDKVAELLKAGHQVMVFVHARKDTVKTAMTFREKANEEGIADLLDPREHQNWGGFQRDLSGSRNREMKELAALGFGIHHAGMLRSDRNITERMFEQNVTKVLCCTATLAWGVNLPAYAVVIKGTQIYDAGKGSFVDLGILDVLQIFGRAGRPQYESQGVGYICTSHDKLDHYVSAITQQHPIESKFTEGLVDSLNAEVALGTVTTMDEGVRWLGYSYLFVRMRKNPLVYGMVIDDVVQDPLLGSKRMALMNNSVKRLLETQMIKYDADLGTLVSTDLGRVASRYYIRNASIEVFNKLFRPRMSEADVLALIAASTEFEQISVRENEVEELKKLIETVAPCQVKGGTDSSAGKVNVLLQAYISRAYIDDFALISDTGYVAQNAGRIVRALLEIAMSKRWAPVTLVLMSMSKAIEKRMWPFNHPLGQFDLPADLMYNIERWADDVPISEIAAMSDADFGALVHQNERLGERACRAARQLPALEITHSLQPVAHDLLRVRLELRRQFEWSEKHHGTTEAFWVWVEDAENLSILQVSRLLVRPSTTVLYQEFIVPITSVPVKLHARAISDRWIGTEDAYLIPLDQLIMPSFPPPHLPLLDLPLLSSKDAFGKHPSIQQAYSTDTPAFDPVQTQVFHTAFHTANNALVCAPSAQSRGIVLELAIWRAFSENKAARVVFVTPRKALARQVSLRLRNIVSRALTIPTLLLSSTKDLDDIPATGPIIVVGGPTPLLRRLLTQPTLFGSLDLILAHDLHALDPSYELLISRLRWAHPTTRVVGSSASLSDPSALASWLSAPEHASYAFSPSTRTSALTTTFHPFSTPHSAALLRSMVRPAYAAMRTASGSSLIFVPSRAQCKATAKDLVTQTASDLDESFVDGSLEMIETYAQGIEDPDLAEALTHGIAVFHEGLRPEEQRLALELFHTGAVRVLIASREACWTLPISASLVLVLSAQFAVLRPSPASSSPNSAPSNDREIQSYPLPELIQMQSLAIPPRSDSSAEFLVLCQQEQAELYGRFLNQGLAVESQLAFDPLLEQTVFGELASVGGRRVRTRQDVVDLLSWTFVSRRLEDNPSYYASTLSSDADPSPLSRLADRLLLSLESRCLLLFSGPTEFGLSVLGKWIGEKGVKVEEIQRIQGVELATLVAKSAPRESGKSSSAAEKGKDDDKGDDSLAAFHSRLPRAVRDSIGSQDSLAGDEYRRRILLGAFAAGRIPRGKGRLEEEQLTLVKRVVGTV